MVHTCVEAVVGQAVGIRGQGQVLTVAFHPPLLQPLGLRADGPFLLPVVLIPSPMEVHFTPPQPLPCKRHHHQLASCASTASHQVMRLPPLPHRLSLSPEFFRHGDSI